MRTLTDEEKEIRQLALEALILDDAEVALTQALESSHPDVSVRAAKAWPATATPSPSSRC